MTLNSFVTSIIFLQVVFSEYGQAELYEGSTCRLHTGNRGVCKNIIECRSVKEGIEQNTLRFDNIVVCSFVGSTQIVCCADEKPLPPHHRRSTLRPNTNTDFVFDARKPVSSTTTLRAPTPNSFWNNWSATQPTNLEDKEIHNHDWSSGDHQKGNLMQDYSTTTRRNVKFNSFTEPSVQSTTESMPSWIQNMLNDHSTTTPMPSWLQNVFNNHETTTTKRTISPTSEVSMPSWMQNVLGEHTTTTAMPIWMQGVLNDHTTTKKPSSVLLQYPSDDEKQSGGGNLVSNTGDGDFIDLSNLNSNSNDNGPPRRNRPSRKPSRAPPTVSSRFRKAEEACTTYSKLPTVSELSWHILNGVPTSPGEFPWMAAIGYDSAEIPGEIEFNCGGTIISDYYVLTAAHCNSARSPAKMVRLGKVTLLTNDDDNEPLDLNIERFIKHPNYSSTTKVHDIALIRVENQIKFTEFIRPACLHTDTNDVSQDVRLIITGWGTISALKTERPTILLQTNVTAVPLSSCNNTLVEFNRAPNFPSLRNGLISGQTCAYDPNAASDACQGDSGGPLQMFEKSTAISSIVGVVSFGVSCGTALPSIYTRVAFYIDWIESIVWST